MIFNIISGLVLLGEADRYPTGHIVGISIGVVITIAGIFVLGSKRSLLASENESKKAERSSLLEAAGEEGVPVKDSLDTIDS